MLKSDAHSRAIGLLVLVQLVTGLILPYVLLLPVSMPAGAFLEQAAPMAGTIRLAVLMLTVGGATGFAIAALVWPRTRAHQPKLGLWLLTLAAINLALQLMENVQWLTMLSVSEAYLAAGATDTDMWRIVSSATYAMFKWVHYSHILVAVIWLFTFYLMLFRGALVPRPIAVAGMGAALLHCMGITLPVFGGFRMPSAELFGPPLGVVGLVLVLWLMIRGFTPGALADAQAEN